MAGPSLREYVWAQVSSRPTDNLQVTKHERVYNFIRVPGKLEHVLSHLVVFSRLYILVFVLWILGLLGCLFAHIHSAPFEDILEYYFDDG